MATVTSVVLAKPLAKTGCTLGEGPLYVSATAVLHFVDILKCQVLHFNTVTSKLTVDQFDAPVSCLALRRNGELACVAGGGFALIDLPSRSLKYISKPLRPEFAAHVRFNDGACDSKGRFFAGTICSPQHNIPGQLYCFDPNTGSATLVDEGPFTDCNGLGWSVDEKTLYLTDSLVNRIYAYDYDDGKMSNRRVFIDALALGLPERTYPDGLCIDSEGGIWSARFGGSKVVRHNADGAIDFEINIPSALNITACCFGGPKDDQLFITTAHCGAVGGDPSRQARYPDSGDIFVADLAGRYKGGKWRYHFGG